MQKRCLFVGGPRKLHMHCAWKHGLPVHLVLRGTLSAYLQHLREILFTGFRMRALVDLTAQIKEPIRYGGGAYSDVYMCRLSGSPLIVAVKSVRCFVNEREVAGRLQNVLRRELDHWRRLGDHPNIVPLLGFASNFGPVNAPVSPWMSNGSLHFFLRGSGNMQTIQEKIRMLEGIGSGLAYLHSRDVVHGDLTSSNILVDEGCNPRLIDFGLASAIGPLQSNQSHLFRHSSSIGAVRWMAPEILSGSELEPSADIYSFGCVMFEVLSGNLPWQGVRETRVIWLKVKENRLPDRPAHANLGERHWALMVRCWAGPQERPTADEMVVLVAGLLDSTDSEIGSMKRFAYFLMLLVLSIGYLNLSGL